MIYTSILGYTKFFFIRVTLWYFFVTQSFTEFCMEFQRVIISYVLLYDNFLLHRVTRSFARSYTELLFPPYYLVIIFCHTELHGVLHGVTQSLLSVVLLCDNFLLHRPSQSVIVSSVLLCEYSVVLCETFFHSLKSQWFSPCPYVKPLLQKIYKTNLLIPSLRLLV